MHYRALRRQHEWFTIILENYDMSTSKLNDLKVFLTFYNCSWHFLYVRYLNHNVTQCVYVVFPHNLTLTIISFFAIFLHWNTTNSSWVNHYVIIYFLLATVVLNYTLFTGSYTSQDEHPRYFPSAIRSTIIGAKMVLLNTHFMEKNELQGDQVDPSLKLCVLSLSLNLFRINLSIGAGWLCVH
jgi:hypothetical protein